MFKQVKPEHTTFIESKRKERDERREARLKEKSAITIQKNWRGFRDRTGVVKEFRLQFDATVTSGPAIDLLRAIKYLSFKFSHENERQRFEFLVRHLMSTIETGKPDVSYLSLALRKTTLVEWIHSTKWLFATILHYLSELDPCSPNGSKLLNVFLSFVLITTDYSRWTFHEEQLKSAMNQLSCVLLDDMVHHHRLFQRLHSLLFKGLARHSPVFTNTSLTGIITLALRPLIYSNFDAKKTVLFAANILTVPGLVLHISPSMNECVHLEFAHFCKYCSTIYSFGDQEHVFLNKQLKSAMNQLSCVLLDDMVHHHRLFQRLHAYDIVLQKRLCSKTILIYHSDPSELEALFSSVEGSFILCFIANLVQLSLLEEEVLALHCSEFCVVVSRLMRHLGGYVGGKKSNLSSWHPILGWFAQPLDNSLQAAMQSVTKQLQLLWNNRMVRLLFGDLYALAELDDVDDRRVGATSNSGLQGYPTSIAGACAFKKSFFPFDVERYSGRVRHGLAQFLSQLSGTNRVKSSRKKKESTSTKLCVTGAHAGSFGPNDLPLSLKAVCMLYCFTVESLREIRNDILAGAHAGSFGPNDLPLSLKAVCMLYCFTVESLREIRNDILAGLSLGDLLPRMWRLISRSGNVASWVKILLDSKPSWQIEPHASHLMHIFTAATSNLLSILDDVELFELTKSFTVDELCSMGTFLNHLIYESVLSVPDPWTLSAGSDVGASFGSNKGTSDSKKCAAIQFDLDGHTLPNLFSMCLRLLSIIHKRDDRHLFTSPDFWLIPNLKLPNFLADLHKSKPHAVFLLQNVPHIIPHKERVLLFRDRVREDKASLGVQTRMSWLTDDGPVGAVITVHRNRLVEDGYQQLANLSSAQLRMKIRVQFVNEMGLDEVGIDLDGVFKEFLEETLHRVFDPSLNLFRVTSDQRIVPGIVVDVPFANFFLTQLLGREKTGCYSFLDELATLDKELYKSLSYIKLAVLELNLPIGFLSMQHYDGDVADLEFTYSYAEDCLGQVVVHDLCPGGRYITVTDDLKIGYVHRVARFRMYKQIRAQTASFIRGFYSILNPDWLTMFSPLELQKLISGDNISVNVDDLRQNTRYSGGFHSNHRVIKWLWDILRRDFTDEERGLFLKANILRYHPVVAQKNYKILLPIGFVTSCSRPPLLGFANLEPPFCIRCVQYTTEDQDVGDTLGSVLKGFFGVGGRREEVSRLPTTSTCFNLLKLPNYSSRSVLRDKLRYAIHSHAGFELS
ncbi:hypothetical protein AHF37_02724 [Paragonimus kellicotti]|nr:hypothetical protein AHF37_02724 [Paragonimus kellicotti]